MSKERNQLTEFRQQYLDFGASDCFHLLHGGHSDRIAVCERNEKWNQKLYDHDAALYAELALVSNHGSDVYHSQNGFNGKSRKTQDVTSLTSFWVDMDVYNIPDLKDIEADDLISQVMAKYDWLPYPTMIIDSGRGYYLQWVFNKPITKDKLPRWQESMDILTGLLKPFGADSNAKDATRVLRVIGSVNQKNGEQVTGYVRTGESVSFAKLSSSIINNGLPLLFDERQKDLSRISDKKVINPDYNATDKQKAQSIRNYQLALDRINDCQTLAALRGSPYMNDYRSRLLYVYACSGVYFWSDPRQVEAEILHFCESNFLDAMKYGKQNVGTVISRLKEKNNGVIGIWNGSKTDRRYRLRNETIITLLEITLEEQQQLKTIISPVERNRRREQRRREAGMIEREQYLANANVLEEQAKELRRRYFSYAEIAKTLGVSKRKAMRLACG